MPKVIVFNQPINMLVKGRGYQMSTEQFQKIINGPGMWVAVIVMIAIVVIQSVVFLKEAVKESKELGVTEKKRKSAIRASIITSIGPSLSPIIMMLAMSAVLGTPYTWFVLNNVGAARTELAAASMGAGVAGVDTMSENIGVQAWCFGIWAGVLNSAGWLIVVFLLNHKMESIVDGLYSRFDSKWIKRMMGGASIALFAYLLGNQLVGKGLPNLVAACIAALASLILSVISRKQKRLQEITMGLSMLIGMFVTQLIFGVK